MLRTMATGMRVRVMGVKSALRRWVKDMGGLLVGLLVGGVDG
jgi:hypothetical protein